ncbi:hypothetical protein VTI74DRAFT_7406 [Chaetomium olivicolor]
MRPPGMVPRIQYHRLSRLAQCPGAVSGLPARYLRAQPSALAPLCSRFQHFSTSSTRRQEPRRSSSVAPEPAEASATVTPEPPADPSSSSTAPTPTPPSPTADPTPQQQQPRSKKRLAPRLILALAFTLLGATAGSSLRMLLSPPQPPEPHTEQDAYTTQLLHKEASKLPIVQQLTAAAEQADSAWESWDAYESLPPEHRRQHITAGALAGSRGVGGYQRVWHNTATGEMVSVVYFGPATTGWPGVVHGGLLATILDESCGRAAFKEWGGKAGVTARLGLEYRRVTMANGFYVVRVKVRGEEELPEEERGKRHYKCFVDAVVEDPVSGQVTVKAEAIFVGGEGKNGGKNNGKNGEGRWGGKKEHFRF